MTNGFANLPPDADAGLRMLRDGRVDGLLCWITLTAFDGGEVIDTLRTRTSWVPVYLPLFDEPVRAAAGDVLDVGFERLAGLDGVHPEYRVTARLHTAGGTATASFTSVHHGDVWRSAAVYRELFRRQATE